MKTIQPIQPEFGSTLVIAQQSSTKGFRAQRANVTSWADFHFLKVSFVFRSTNDPFLKDDAWKSDP